ncbi:MAG: ABC transporter permease subunit [Acidobacteriota bacterium]
MMFWHIVKKEALTNILNLRFTIGAMLCFLVMIVSMVVSERDYQNRFHTYKERTKLQNQALDSHANINDIGGLIITKLKSPSALSIFAKGFDENIEIESLDMDSISLLYQNFDPLFVISTLLSLMAILFSYDTISTEKEGRTLPLVLSNSLRRNTLFLSKWLGGMLTISIMIFLPSFLTGLIILVLGTKINLESQHWYAILFIVIFSILYLSIFYCIGVFISILALNSFRSILISLFFWAFFILISPTLSSYISTKVYKISSPDIIDHQLAQLEKERQGEIQRALRPYYISNVKMPESEIHKLAGIEKIKKKYSKKRSEIVTNYKRKTKYQVKITKWVSSILSPIPSFIYLVTEISSTGLDSVEEYNKQKDSFDNIFWSYVKRKYAGQLRKNPNFSVNDRLDLSDRPFFTFKNKKLSERISSNYPFIFILFFYFPLFLILSNFVIQKADVR